jgi:hypothetical protein
VNILDIVSNLENKLNIAIKNKIAQDTQNEFYTPLNNERETYRFKLYLDTANYMGYDYLKRTAEVTKIGTFSDSNLSDIPTSKIVRYINGVISVVDSNIQGGVNLSDSTQATSDTNLTFSAGVVFFIPLTSADNDTMELVGTVREIIDNAMQLNTYADFNGYNMSVAYSLGRTGERLIRKGVGDSITINCNIQYGFVESGINSTQIRIKYGNSIIYAPSKSLTRVSTQEANVDLTSDSNSSKSTTISSCLTLSFSKPFQNTDFDGEAAYYMLYGDMGKVFDLDISFINLTERIPMVFNEVSITGENTLNAGLTITMVQAMESD